MADTPSREFGTRKPVAIAPAQPIKRGQVALLLMGTLAVGGGAYALMPNDNCEPTAPGMAAPTGCQPRGSSSGGGGSRGGSSRYGFFSGDSSSGSSSASTTTSSESRGGFGSFAHSFGAHFSGG